MKRALLSLAVAGLISTTAQAAQPGTLEYALEQIQVLSQRVQALEAENKDLREAQEETAEKVEATGEMVAEAASSSSGGSSKTKLGGYGELHYNNVDGEEEIDFHRFVLYVNHEFNETTRLFTEFELEHALAGEGKEGEVELEQAYIQHDLNDSHSVNAGVFLVPVGILNETHEPNTFYGVERNPVEKNIIPTTWWEAGVGLSSRFSNGISTDVALTSSLDVFKTDDEDNDVTDYKVRGGRQKVSNATAESKALTGRIKYTGVPGLELAATISHHDDITQGKNNVSATLYEAHAIYNTGPFGLRALYASWDLDGPQPAALGRDEQTGWYIEPSYRINDKFGLFARHAVYDNEAGNSADTEISQSSVGFNYWLNENAVFKFDYESNDYGAEHDKKDSDGFNLGVGYQIP